jgi:hypothetical protein
MKLIDYINKHHGGNRTRFAEANETRPQQVTKWLRMECIVIDGVLYSPRRELAEVERDA